MEKNVKVKIGDGVTVQGPESLLQEALGAHETPPVGFPEFMDELFCGIDPEAETKVDGIDTRAMQWMNHPDGSVSDIRPVGSSSPPQRLRAGDRVWHRRTEQGPLILVAPLRLTIPVELPVFDIPGCGDPYAGALPAHREIEVMAWAAEAHTESVGATRILAVPEALLTQEAPLRLSEELLEALEEEALEETVAEAAEEVVRTNSEVFTVHREVRRLRSQIGWGIAAAMVGTAVLAPAILGWLAYNLR